MLRAESTGEHMAIDTAQQVMQLGDYAKRLSAARDRSYALAREVERSRGVLDFMAHDPASDPALCEYATKALELLCENLVRLCALTDEASANAEALASLPLKYFQTRRAPLANWTPRWRRLSRPRPRRKPNSSNLHR
jgi:hypothetical protein